MRKQVRDEGERRAAALSPTDPVHLRGARPHRGAPLAPQPLSRTEVVAVPVRQQYRPQVDRTAAQLRDRSYHT